MRSLPIVLVVLSLLGSFQALALPLHPGDVRNLTSLAARRDPLGDVQMRGISASKPKPDAATSGQEGLGDCSNPATTFRLSTTGARCAAHEMGGIGFRRTSGVGGCLDSEQMRNVQETGTCWLSRSLPRKAYDRPINVPVGPRPPAGASGQQTQAKVGSGSAQPQKPVLKINTNV